MGDNGDECGEGGNGDAYAAGFWKGCGDVGGGGYRRRGIVGLGV